MPRPPTRILLFVITISLAGAATLSAEDFYSEGGWATLHRGPDNRKWVSDTSLAEDYEIWTALEGSAVLTAPTLSPDGRTLYATTGKSAGHSNLHAFDLESGRLLWQSEPWRDRDHGLDPCAVLSSAIVDREGDLYIGDCNQLFAFRPDGQLKWVVPLPVPREEDWKPSAQLTVNALTTAVFTRDGFVFGVTNFGDVIVVDRETGASMSEPFRMPGHLPSADGAVAVVMPESVFSDGLLDPEIRQWAWRLLFGGSMRSTNTPAMDLRSGRIFVAATSSEVGKGALYGLDLRTEPGDVEMDDPSLRRSRVEISIAFSTEMGPGSGSSPALSPGGDRAYVSDETGVFYAIDTTSGAIRWQVETRATAAAASVGGDGDIYALQAFGPALVAMTKAGQIRWESDLSELAKAALPSSWLLGDVVAVGNGNPTAVGDRVLVPIAYGYETRFGRRIPWLVSSVLVAVDARTGEGLRDIVSLADDSTGITAVLPDGTILNSLGTAVTSAIAPLRGIAEWLLPRGLHLLTPVGGIQISRPIER